QRQWAANCCGRGVEQFDPFDSDSLGRARGGLLQHTAALVDRLVPDLFEVLLKLFCVRLQPFRHSARNLLAFRGGQQIGAVGVDDLLVSVERRDGRLADTTICRCLDLQREARLLARRSHYPTSSLQRRIECPGRVGVTVTVLNPSSWLPLPT